MPILTDGPTMEPPNKGIDEFHTGRMESLGASASEAFSDLPTVQLSGMIQTERAKGTMPDFGELASGMPTPGLAEENKKAASAPRIDIIDANDRVKKAGLAPHLKLPDQPDIPPAQLEIMMNRATARREREATIERGPQGFVQSSLSVGTSFLVGAVDPINVASAFIPVMGELRYAKLLESAGEGFGARLAARAGVGAAQGAVGQAALEPLDWWSHTQDGRDFGMSDVLHNILFGAVLGGAMHAGGGAVSDIYRSRQGRALYPFGPGEPLENVQGTHLPAGVLHEDGITPDALEQHFKATEPPFDVGRTTVDINGERTVIDTDLAAVRAAQMAHDPAAHEPIFPEAPDDHHVTPASLTGEHQASRPEIPSATVQTIDDLPQRAKEDAARAGIANLIDGEPLRVGEMLEAAAQTDPRIAESFEAFHGSPYDFERFDISKIGTGEGAQAYGYGLYFAQSENVARRYQENLGGRTYWVTEERVDAPREPFEPLNPIHIAAKAIHDHSELTGGDARQRAIKALERSIDEMNRFPESSMMRPSAARIAVEQDALDLLREKSALPVIEQEAGNLYKVRITSDRSKFLDWDKDLREQPHVIKALDEHPKLKEELEEMLDDAGYAADIEAFSGRELYQLLRKYASEGSLPGDLGTGGHENKEVGEFLARLGIHGIEYLDSSSRGGVHTHAKTEIRHEDGMWNVYADGGLENAFNTKKEAEKFAFGTRNFVVFDDKHIEITHKNGEPVHREQFLAEREAERNTTHVTAKPARGRAAADPATWSLYEFLAHEGGLKADPELQAIFGNHKGPFVPGFGALVRPTGRSLDDALRLAKDHGYMFDAADVTGAEGRLTPNDLLDRLSEENSGRKQFRMDQSVASKVDVEREAHEIISALHDELEATTGVKGTKVDPHLEDRVVQIVTREGEHDVLAAYERAIMEDAERYEGFSRERQNHAETAAISGWDHADAGAASRLGAADPRPRRQGRLSNQGEGQADGGEPRGDGDGDRAPLANALDRDAAWRQLAQATPEFDDPAVLAASNAAADIKTPPTKLDERLTAAQKADAFAKQMYDMFADRLPEQDRLKLDDLIKTIDSDHEAREIAIKQGGACLFGARG